MKVSYWYNNNDIRIEEVPTPVPGPKEMLVKVISCGICGSDIVEWYRSPRAPLVQGHEIGAEVVATGADVKKHNVGDRVFIAPKVPCGKCFYCRNGHDPQCSEVRERLPGGFAEYILVPEILVERGTYRLPENITFDQSTFIEPLACVVRAQRRACVKKEQSVMVIGCGMGGLLNVKLARQKGCKVIAVDINPKKLEFAKRMGANITLNAAESFPDRLISQNGKKADAVFLCASADSAVEQAWKCVDKGGVIVLFAVPAPDKQVVVPVNDFWMKEITIQTSYYCGPPDIASAMNLIESRKVVVDDLITHRLPLTDIVKGFKLVSDGLDSIKVIIKPHE
ncbi:MAG: alcohol dehydrogenase [Chloroflexi bacterium HGW-Chloroflexi-5]|jgi:L-iditol 2-dehydrogenase|nr:MAG: alcohol dehydrogenase [Deltaproteobacteria bacterium HGW-Deltaproteobacteria-9]PKN96483.1 MAG: alcohol dehydrogenase [Chloroflexi bacterium HGW-Chloroflexi-5]